MKKILLLFIPFIACGLYASDSDSDSPITLSASDTQLIRHINPLSWDRRASFGSSDSDSDSVEQPITPVATDIQHQRHINRLMRDAEINPQSTLFDTKFVDGAPKAVREFLINAYGFKPVGFTTADGVTIRGLLKVVPKAEYSIVLSSGFLPGRMTGLSTFAEILKNSCNILLYNGRGKGDSSGALKFWQLWRYGVDDHYDVQAALAYLKQACPEQPIIAYGSCAGAFHSARALLKMSEAAQKGDVAQEQLLKQIKGLVFDSGWASVIETAPHALRSSINKLLPWGIKHGVKGLLRFYLPVLQRYYRRHYEAETQLYGKMHKMPCPVLLIHSHDDTFAPYNNVEALVKDAFMQSGNNAALFLWFINNSKHTVHHLKHKFAYTKVLLDFINTALTRQRQLKDNPEKLYFYHAPETTLGIEQRTAAQARVVNAGQSGKQSVFIPIH